MSAPTGWLTLKWMLPSPRWPNGSGRRPASALPPPPSPRARKSGTALQRHRDVVLDRAALGLLRLRHAPRAAARSARAGRASCGDRRVGDQPALDGLAEQVPPARRASPSSPGEDISISTYQGCRPDERIAAARHVAQHEVEADARHQLEGGDVGAGPRLARGRAAPSAASGDGHADEGGRDAPRGCGNSFSTAAVMMPSVPSAPMNRLLQVVAGVVLAQLAQARSRCGRRPAPPRARAPGRARCRRRAPRCRRHWWRGCRRSWQVPSAASDSGNSRPASAAASWARLQRDAGLAPSWSRCRGRSRGCGRAAASDSTISRRSASGIWPPTSPVLPPCGTIGTPGSRASRTTAATSAVVPGRTTARAAPAIEAARLDEIGRGVSGGGEDVPGPDHGGETVKQRVGRGRHGKYR